MDIVEVDLTEDIQDELMNWVKRFKRPLTYVEIRRYTVEFVADRLGKDVQDIEAYYDRMYPMMGKR